MTKTVPKMRESRLPGSETELEPKLEWEPRYPGCGRLDRKVAIVTGGDSGIGRAVAPRPIWTPLNLSGGASDESLEDFGKSTPMLRPGQLNEVAPGLLFLAYEDSRCMTGQVLYRKGGIIVGS